MATALPSSQTSAIASLAWFFVHQGYPLRAARLYETLALLEPTRPAHLRGLALSLADAGQHERALTALDRLALLGAVDRPYHLLRAQVLVPLGRESEAQASMRTYLEMPAARAPARADA